MQSAYEAQDFIVRQACDIIFVDFIMPGLNGIDLVKWVRKQPSPISSITLIGLTASSLQKDWSDGMEAGMSSILTKPVDRDHLIKVVQQTFFEKS